MAKKPSFEEIVGADLKASIIEFARTKGYVMEQLKQGISFTKEEILQIPLEIQPEILSFAPSKKTRDLKNQNFQIFMKYFGLNLEIEGSEELKEGIIVADVLCVKFHSHLLIKQYLNTDKIEFQYQVWQNFTNGLSKKRSASIILSEDINMKIDSLLETFKGAFFFIEEAISKIDRQALASNELYTIAITKKTINTLKSCEKAYQYLVGALLQFDATQTE